MTLKERGLGIAPGWIITGIISISVAVLGWAFALTQTVYETKGEVHMIVQALHLAAPDGSAATQAPTDARNTAKK